MSVPDNVVNKTLYKKVKSEADAIYKRPTSAYKSMWISKTYMDRGGKYKGKKQSLTEQWRRERWVQVVPYVQSGKIIECGASNRTKKVCRPLIRVNKDTPMTIDEVVAKWGKQKVLTLAKSKINDMDGRLMWKTGKFISSYSG